MVFLIKGIYACPAWAVMAFRMTGIAPAAAMVTWLSFIVRLVKARLQAAVHIHTSAIYSFVNSENLFSSTF